MTHRSVMVAGAILALAASGPATAAAVSFSSATATYHQTFDRDWSPSEMIDGITTGADGWAIYRFDGAADQTLSETALFTTATPLVAGPTTLTFTIYQNYGQSHLLGDFSLAYTTAVAPTLASAQVALNLTGESSLNGTTFTSQAMGQLLAGGPLPQTDVYTITATVNSASPVTGFFLNAIDDPNNGLATGGPGRQTSNGNFVLSEFTADATPSAAPEPAAWSLMLVGLGGLGLALRSRRKSALA